MVLNFLKSRVQAFCSQVNTAMCTVTETHHTQYSFTSTAVNLSALAWGQSWFYRRQKRNLRAGAKRGQWRRVRDKKDKY